MVVTLRGRLRAARRWRRAIALLSALTMAGSLSGCGVGNGGFELNQPGGPVGFSNYTGPGIPADFSGFIGPSTQPVTLLAATLLPIPGFPAPRLVHLGVHLIRNHGDITGANYWPPRLPPPRRGEPQYVVPVSAFRGYRLAAGRHSLLLPFYSFVGSRPGVNYFAAGLRITYRVGRADYTGNWYAFGSSGVIAPWAMGANPRTHCRSAPVNGAIDAYIHVFEPG